MGHFLRDQQIINITLDEARLRSLSELMRDRAGAVNRALEEPNVLHQMYVIRFDSKGYRVFDIDDVLRLYQNANEVERVICTIESAESFRSRRLTGSSAEVVLDKNNPNGCTLVVTSDDENFVDATFGAISDRLHGFRNRYGIIRNAWTALALQIAGVVVGFVVCLWGATKIAPSLSIENAFALSFLFLLLVFSNFWTYLNQLLLRSIDKLYPNVVFVRAGKERWHWLLRAVVGSVVAGIVIFLLSKLFTYAGILLGGFLK